MKKKMLCLFLALMSVFSFSACSSNKWEDELAKRNKPLNLTIWTYYSADAALPMDKLVDLYNVTAGKESNISVTTRHFSNINGIAAEIAKAASGTAVDAPEMPSMFMTYPDDCWEIDRLFKKVASLDKYFTQGELDAYEKSFLDEGRYDGKNLKIVPLAKSSEIFTMNETDWKIFANEYNVQNPGSAVALSDLTTMEGILDVSKKYYEFSGGKAFYGRDAMANYIYTSMEMLGGKMFSRVDGETKVDIDKQKMRVVFDNHFVPMVQGYFCATGSYRTDDIKNKLILAAVGSSSSVRYFPVEINISQTDKKPIDAYITPVPKFEGKELITMQQGGGIAVAKKTELEEYASCKFLKWLTAPTQNIKFSVESGYVPVTKEGLNKDKLVEHVKVPDDASVEAKRRAENTKAGLAATVDSFKNYNSYFGVPFESSSTVRNVLDWVLQNKVEDVSKKPKVISDEGLINSNDAILLVKSGVKTKEYFMSDEFYNEWYEKLCSVISKTIKK